MSGRLIAAVALLAVLALAGAAATGLLGPGPSRERAYEPVAPRSVQPALPPSVEPRPAPAAQGAGFRSEARLREHHDKHGHEFGRVTAAQYLAMARALRDRPPGPRILEATRADGVVTRFDRDSGAFLAFDRDGTIRTFFKPRDGEAYFRRQRDRG